MLATVPFLSNLGATSYNAAKGSQSGADMLSDMAGAAKGLGSMGPTINRAVDALQANRDWATPFATAGIGALAGNTLGRMYESSSADPKERDSQTRNRLLAALAGAAIGGTAGYRSTHGLPALTPSSGESASLASMATGIKKSLGLG